MIVSFQTIVFSLLLYLIDVLNSDMTSSIFFHDIGTDFIPLNSKELLGIHSSIFAEFSCSLICHEDPQCRTFVFDRPTCRLYEGIRETGQVILTSNLSIVGEILYDNIDLSSSYNQTCDHYYPDRYLVCKNDRCQCPLNTFWNGQGRCLNQQYINPLMTCNNNDWCRQDMNLTCFCNKCRCPVGTLWSNQRCVPQYTQGTPCNSSDQCRNDLQLVCSRINQTCIAPTPRRITVINGTIPDKFSSYGLATNWSGTEWWRAFDNQTGDFWNSAASWVTDYIYITLDDTYLLTSFQLTVIGDTTHDPKLVELYLDENATCLAGNFTFPRAPSNWYTFTPTSLSTVDKPIVVKQILLGFIRYSVYQLWLPGFTLFGIPY